MKKLFLTCLMLLAGSAWAEWVMYAESSTTYHYFDPSTIRKDGNMRRVWLLNDFKQLAKDGTLSGRFRAEYDCKNERWRILAVSEHSEPMAGGSTMRSENDTNPWLDIPPDTFSEIIFKIVCAK